MDATLTARRWMSRLLPIVATVMLTGCAVVAVADAAVSVTAGAVGLAADTAIGTARIVGKGVGKAADAMLGGEGEQQKPAAHPQ